MIRIILVRHPQTTWNQKGKLQGWKEGRITPKGKIQAGKFLQRLHVRVDKLFCADNKRTEYLAKLIATKINIQFSRSKKLREKSFGIYEGKKSSKIASLVRWSELSIKERYTRTPPQGESLQAAGQRAKKFLDALMPNSNNETILLITSGALIKSLLVQLNLLNLNQIYKFRVENCAAIHLEFDANSFRLQEKIIPDNDVII